MNSRSAKLLITSTPCVLLLFVLAACASDVANRYYSSKTYPPKQVDKVDLLYVKPERPFEVIADFQSRGESERSIQKKAAKLGADAVIVTTLGGLYSRSEEWAGKDRHSGTGSRIVGTAIVYVQE